MAGAQGLHECHEASTNDLLHALFEGLAELDDSTVRERAMQLVAELVELYGAGLARLVQVLDEAGPAATPVRRLLAEDEVVARLLLVHGLYPLGRTAAGG